MNVVCGLSTDTPLFIRDIASLPRAWKAIREVKTLKIMTLGSNGQFKVSIVLSASFADRTIRSSSRECSFSCS